MWLCWNMITFDFHIAPRLLLCALTPKLSSGGLLGMIPEKPIKGPPSAAAICSAWVYRGRITDHAHGNVARPVQANWVRM